MVSWTQYRAINVQEISFVNVTFGKWTPETLPKLPLVMNTECTRKQNTLYFSVLPLVFIRSVQIKRCTH